MFTIHFTNKDSVKVDQNTKSLLLNDKPVIETKNSSTGHEFIIFKNQITYVENIIDTPKNKGVHNNSTKLSNRPKGANGV